MKRIVSLILAVMLCASLAAPAMAADKNFSDVPASHWAYTDIRSAAGKGIITGYADGTFKPAGTVTNAQFLTMIARAFYADELANNELRVSDGDEYYLPALYTLVPLGILNDTSFGNTYIEDWIGKASAVKNINRYDMAQVMYNVMTGKGYSVSSSERSTAQSKISDWRSIPSQYQTGVASCYALGLLGGYSDGQYKGTQTMNRAQAATVIERLYKALDGNVTPAKPAETSSNLDANTGTGGQVGSRIYNSTMNIMVAQPSTGIWTGWQGRAYGAEVVSEADVPGVLQSCMDGYPSTVVFFSQRQLTLDRDALLEQYEISHGLHTRIKAVCYDTTCFVPKGMTGTFYEHTAGNYYEYRIDLHYDAAGFVRMYREGIISSFPTTADFSFQAEAADYTLLLNTVEQIERTYGVSVNSSDYDKALACYRWITENITYDYYMASLTGNDLVDYFDSVAYPSEINFALTYHKGVCFEYALLYQALCCVMKVNCFVVTGTTSINHAWNMVQIDGHWYQADATWDAGDPPERYSYFLVSDAVMSGRSINQGYYRIPNCPVSYSR